MKNLALLVEDEAELGISLKLALKKLNFETLHAYNLEDARRLIKDNVVSLVILDRMLPDGEGLDLCFELRSAGFAGGIVALTAKGATSEVVEGLNAGADDYLPKPFSWEEFEARVQAVLRRATFNKPAEKAWATKPDSFMILGPKGWVTLTKIEFLFASRLMASAGEVLTRETLLKDVWGYSWLPETRTVDFFFGRLRKKLEKDPRDPKHFLTIRGAGYQFAP